MAMRGASRARVANGRAAPGIRVLEQGLRERGGNVLTIGALALEGVRTGLHVPGPIDGDTMLSLLRSCWPTFKRGDIVVMDNTPIPQLDDLEDALEAVSAWLLFLSTSSPDLNPIENSWSKVKARLRALKPRTLPDFLEALVTAFASITEHDILGWFGHYGYRVAPT